MNYVTSGEGVDRTAATCTHPTQAIASPIDPRGTPLDLPDDEATLRIDSSGVPDHAPIPREVDAHLGA